MSVEDAFSQAARILDNDGDLAAMLTKAKAAWDRGDCDSAFWILEAFHLGQMMVMRSKATEESARLAEDSHCSVIALKRRLQRSM
ncbi:hypothetical protein KW786_03105 [Candidatus Parcubacteria bacterium]|nr:hypothetical protein [Candidatus Parcubacteria bacterium]